MDYPIIAAVDLGSNSFRIEIGRIEGDRICTLDSLKEPVRLAAGLTAHETLDDASQQRALEALRRFGERLRGFDPGGVRAVATNALRVAKNAPQFLPLAEAALGFPIEVIGGREEARLIYLGVAHAAPVRDARTLVVDIGGGSTELIIGRRFEPLELDSLWMGCVSYSLKYFPGGRLEKTRMRDAELAARQELQAIARRYRDAGWEIALGSSGTAQALADALEQNGLSASGLTLEGLEGLKQVLLDAGDLARLPIQGVGADRLPVLPGGLAIMCAVFKELGVDRMLFSEGALRLGVLYDLLGRWRQADMREATVEQFMRRYAVDHAQAQRVAASAEVLCAQILPRINGERVESRFLRWSALLHEIGTTIARDRHQQHGAYILAHADMPGFSRVDQARLSRLVLAHRGRLERVPALTPADEDWSLVFCLRIAALLHRARAEHALPRIEAQRSERGFQLNIERQWLEGSPLAAAALAEEARQWQSVGIELRIQATL